VGFINRQFLFVERNERKLQKSHTKKKRQNINVNSEDRWIRWRNGSQVLVQIIEEWGII